MPYSIYWLQANEQTLITEAPFLNIAGAEFIDNDPVNWPNGYKVVDQDLSGSEWSELDDLADLGTLINIYPTPRPPYSPTQR